MRTFEDYLNTPELSGEAEFLTCKSDAQVVEISAL